MRTTVPFSKRGVQKNVSYSGCRTSQLSYLEVSLNPGLLHNDVDEQGKCVDRDNLHADGMLVRQTNLTLRLPTRLKL